jgi:hypothetical protein
MSHQYTCGELQGDRSDALVAYLYDECDPAEREAIEAHLSLCASCTDTVAALQATRAHLKAWTPPEAELGFQIVKQPAVSRAAHWWQQPLPAWAQMAAAALIFAIGAGVGASFQPPASSSPAPVVATAPVAAPDAATARDLAALEDRMRRELAAVRRSSDARSATTVNPARVDSDELLQRVRSIIAESEQRQQRELAFRLAQVVRDIDSQRRFDLARIERTFGRMEGATGAELADQRRAINLMRVSGRQ